MYNAVNSKDSLSAYKPMYLHSTLILAVTRDTSAVNTMLQSVCDVTPFKLSLIVYARQNWRPT